MDVLHQLLQLLIPDGNTVLMWLVEGVLAAGLVVLVSNLIAGALGAIPVVGPALATIARVVGGSYQKWLSDEVAKMAKQSVLAVEERYRSAENMPPAKRAQAKMNEALEELNKLAPGLRKDLAKSAIEAALAQIRPTHEQKAELTPKPSGRRHGKN